MIVCVAGTFNIFHKGHKQLIDTAFQTAGKNGRVFIGITEGELLREKKFTKPITERKNAVKEYLSIKGYENRSVIKTITDKYDITIDGDFDAIIVSPETIENAHDINKKRISLGKKPLRIIEIPHVLAEDNKPISSTRIFNKEIDENGKVLG
ncbi:MAG: pantetheine-phosphate adenylyltransferase [Methanobacteriota archaeon]